MIQGLLMAFVLAAPQQAIQTQLPPTGTYRMSGTVAVEGNGPRPRFNIVFNRVDATANPVNALATSTFTVTVAQGQYRLTTTGLPAGYTVKSITVGTVDALTQPVVLAPGTSQVIAIVLGVSSPAPWVTVSGRLIGGTATSVTMNGTATTEALTTTVGPNGAFEFPMVLPGTYTARILPPSPLVPTTPITVGSTNIANVEIRIPATKEVVGKITLRGNFPMPRAVLSLAPTGAPATNAAPAALSIISGVIVTTVAGSVSIPTNPGADGLFKITLPEGERKVTIIPSSIPAGYSVDSFTYGTTDLLKNPIRVALNDSAEIAISVDATQVRPRNISGKVTGLLTTQGVRVVLQGGNLGTGVESPVAPDGSFAFTDILPGTYQARLSLSGVVIATSVRVDNQDVTGLIIAHPRRFVVAAHVVVDGDTGAAPAPKVTLEAKNAAGGTTPATVIATSSGGPMQMSLPDGEHTVSVRNIPAGYQLKSIRYGTTDLQESPLKIDGPITWEIIVRLVKTGR